MWILELRLDERGSNEKVRDQRRTEGGLMVLNNTADDVMEVHDALSHHVNMLLCYFSLTQNRDTPSGLAVQSWRAALSRTKTRQDTKILSTGG